MGVNTPVNKTEFFRQEQTVVAVEHAQKTLLPAGEFLIVIPLSLEDFHKKSRVSHARLSTNQPVSICSTKILL